MGWCSGAEMADDIWAVVKKYVPKAKRKQVARQIVKIFENQDADTMLESEVGEAAGIVHDEEWGSHWEWEKPE